jgi:hypothetical protein
MLLTVGLEAKLKVASSNPAKVESNFRFVIVLVHDALMLHYAKMML